MPYISKNFDDETVRLLKAGGIGFMPSDTIYGLSALALDKQAVNRLHNLKDRASNKPFIILILDTKMLNLLSIDEKLAEPATDYWPGGLTLVIEASDAPEWLRRGFQTLAVRVPDELNLRELIQKVGPLISTSANPEGQKPAETIDEALSYFGDKLDFYIDAGNRSGYRPSTIARLKGGKLEVIRQGAVMIKEEDTYDAR